jgi:hypothetical protein
MIEAAAPEIWGAAGALVAGVLAFIAALARKGEQGERRDAAAAILPPHGDGAAADAASAALASAIWRGSAGADLARLSASLARVEVALVRLESDLRAVSRGVDTLRERRD